MSMKQTSVIIDVDKWNTLKARGYKLQDIVDTAFNNLLDINLTDNLELNKEINNLNEKKKYLLNDVEHTKNKYDTKINDLKSNIDLIINEKDKLIADLEEEIKKEIAEKDKELSSIEKEIKSIDFKIKAIEETIITNEKQAKEDKKLSEEKLAKLRERNIMYNNIFNRFRIGYANSNPNGSLDDYLNNNPEAKEYCNKYNMSLQDLYNKIRSDLIENY